MHTLTALMTVIAACQPTTPVPVTTAEASPPPTATQAGSEPNEPAGRRDRAGIDRADGSDGILRHTVGEIVAGAAADKPVMIGVQTAADELDKLTFYEEGAAAMERELDAVRQALTGAAGFGGIAVHHLDSYRRLRH